LCSGVTLWNESVDGDLSNSNATRTLLGSIGTGSWDIIGSLDGGPNGVSNGPDEDDIMEFTALGAWTMDLTSLSLTNTGSFFLFLFDGSNGFLNLHSGTVNQNNIFGTYAAGTYILDFIPQSNGGQVDYAVRVNVAGVPDSGTSVALLGLALAGLAFVRRRIA
jgi:hypothetical protein